MKRIYDYRKVGQEYCKTDGANHYKSENGIEPAEFAIANNMHEEWMLINIVKYAMRFQDTRNPKDLMKIADYAHILCGIELEDIDKRKQLEESF